MSVIREVIVNQEGFYEIFWHRELREKSTTAQCYSYEGNAEHENA